MTRLKLELSHDDYHVLVKAVDTRRDHVRVSRAMLDTLLRDHSALIAHHKGEVTE